MDYVIAGFIFFMLLTLLLTWGLLHWGGKQVDTLYPQGGAIVVAEAELIRWLSVRWRTGRSLGRTIYAQLGVEPSKDDVFLGIMDTRALAARVVMVHNERLMSSGTPRIY